MSVSPANNIFTNLWVFMELVMGVMAQKLYEFADFLEYVCTFFCLPVSLSTMPATQYQRQNRRTEFLKL
jgi:hypothetical protein